MGVARRRRGGGRHRRRHAGGRRRPPARRSAHRHRRPADRGSRRRRGDRCTRAGRGDDAALHGAAPRLARRDRRARGADSGRPGHPLLPARGASAPSRCSSAAPCGCAARATRPRCTSCGCRSRSSASSRSRSAAGSIGSTGCSTGPTSIADPGAAAALPALHAGLSRAADQASAARRLGRVLEAVNYAPAHRARPHARGVGGAQLRPTPRSSCAISDGARSAASSSTWPSASSAGCWC